MLDVTGDHKRRVVVTGGGGCRSLTRLKALRLRGFSADEDDDNEEEDDASSRNRDVIQVPCAPVNAGPAMAQRRRRTRV